MAESLADTLQMYELIYKILPLLTNFSYAGNFIAAALCPLSSEGSFLAALQQLFVSLALCGPKPGAVLQVQPHQCRTEQKN